MVERDQLVSSLHHEGTRQPRQNLLTSSFSRSLPLLRGKSGKPRMEGNKSTVGKFAYKKYPNTH